MQIATFGAELSSAVLLPQARLVPQPMRGARFMEAHPQPLQTPNLEAVSEPRRALVHQRRA
jgi:hypothetical protein